MSTTPPPPPPEPPHRGYGYAHGAANPFAGMTIPFNAELVVFVLIEIIFAIIWIAAESVNTHDWVWFSTILTAFYILSRGIAKASRVLEQ